MIYLSRIIILIYLKLLLNAIPVYYNYYVLYFIYDLIKKDVEFLMSESEKFFKKWNKYRQHGKVKYILLFGVLIDTLYFLLFVTLIFPMLKYNFNFYRYSWFSFIKNVGIGITVGPIIGFITGYTQWNANEHRYATMMEHEDRL